MQENGLLRKPKKALFIIIFVAAHILILRNVFLLSKDMLYGDFSAGKLLPSTRYGFERIPDDPSTQQYHAQNRLAVDFAQIYFPSQQIAALSESYQTGVLDPMQRPSRYAPMLHFLCSITICKLDYGVASLLHMTIQTLLFYMVIIYSFKALKIEIDLLSGLLLLNCYLFLSPAGLSWFERGQFSLYVSIGYLLMIIGFIKKNDLLVLYSALFAFVKWTSFPAISVIFSVYILNSKSLAEGKRNLLLAAAFLLIIISLSLPFPDQSLYFLKGLYDQERFAVPGGISLAKILPVTIAKTLPVLLIVLGFLHVKINQNAFERIIPFLAGSAILMLTFPTLAYEYNLPSLLCFIPLVFYWTKLSNDTIKVRVRKVMKYSFFAFVLFASFSNYINQKVIVMSEYCLISLILLLVPLFYYWKSTRDPNRSKKINIQ
jgi:hypothetical protein